MLYYTEITTHNKRKKVIEIFNLKYSFNEEKHGFLSPRSAVRPLETVVNYTYIATSKTSPNGP